MNSCLLTKIKNEYFGNCTLEICMNMHTSKGSAYRLVSVICSASEGFNTNPLSSPTEALHRKAVDKTPETMLSLCDFSHLQLSQQTHRETG